MKDFIVIFSENGAKIVKDPETIKKRKNDNNVLFNPTIPKSIPPHQWVKDGDEIKVKTEGKDTKYSISKKFLKNKSDLLNFEIKLLRILLGMSVLGNIINVFVS